MKNMLQLNGIKLRAPEPGDVDFLFDLENDSRLWHLSNTQSPFSRFDLEQYVLMADKDIYSSRQIRFVIEKVEGKKSKTIGTIDIFDFEPKHKRAGVGITLLEDERGKGFAAIALKILIRYAFEYLKLYQLYCEIEQDNVTSINLFEKAGFKLSGVKRQWLIRGFDRIDVLFYQLIEIVKPE
ncbi:MAG: GNAT family protein [Bacteroidales bacterium]|jgi:diamine N-acetyltransferase